MGLLDVPIRDLFKKKKRVGSAASAASTMSMGPALAPAPVPGQYRGATVGDLITIMVFIVLFGLVGWLMYSARLRTVTPEEMDVYRQFCWVAVAVSVKTLGSTVGQMFGLGGYGMYGGFGGYGGMVPQQPAPYGAGQVPGQVPGDPFSGLMAMGGKALSTEDPLGAGGDGPESPMDVHGGRNQE